MDGIAYEKYCKEYLQKNGYHKVSFTKASHDQGIDLIAYKAGMKYGFQCKYYDRTVSNKAVQEAYTGAAYYGCDRAGVITNQTFTLSAQKLAEETEVLLIEQIDPEKTYPVWYRYRLYCLIPIIAGILFLYNNAANASESLIFGYSFCILSGIFALFHNYPSLFASMISSIIYMLCTFAAGIWTDQTGFLWTYQTFFLILNCLIFVYHYKKHLGYIAYKERQFYREQIRDTLHQSGKHYARILSDELQVPIFYSDASLLEKGMQSYSFRSSKDLTEDIPLLQYNLNQYAQASRQNISFELSSINPREFYMIVSEKKTA